MTSIGKEAAWREGEPRPRFGIDFGGVIVRSRRWHRGEDTDLAGSDGEDAAREGVFRAVREIVSVCEGRVWIVSKAGPRMQARSLAWLEAVDFYARTNLDPEKVRFCRERTEKEGICRELGITHFVDDRIHVMQILRHAVPHLYLFGERGEERSCPPWATFVTAWDEVVRRLRSSVRTEPPAAGRE
jgi:hypothetical protein